MSTARASGSSALSDANQPRDAESADGTTPIQMDSIPTGNMNVPVSKPQRELLDNNDVMEKLQSVLEEHGVTVETDTLHTECIVVLQGDPETARQCLMSVVYTETVTFDTSEPVSLVLSDLHSKFPARFAMHFRRGTCTADVAYLHSIRSEALLVLEKLKTSQKLVPLPNYMANFIQRHLQRFKAYFSANLSFPLGVTITEEYNQTFLQLSCERVKIPVAQTALEKLLIRLHYTQVNVRYSLGLYLLSPAGKRHVQGIEESCACTVNVETSGERILMTARSPQGHQVMVCEGNMAATDCRVIALPLRGGQKEWSSLHRFILERACLNTDPKTYTHRLGPPPKHQTLQLQCQGPAVGQTVIIMYIPPHSDGGSQELVCKAAREVLEAASAVRSGLGLPLMISEDGSADNLRDVVLKAIIDCYNDSTLPPEVKFYLDVGSKWPDTTSIFQSAGWTCEKHTDDSRYMDRVKFVIGDILDEKADAVVNSTDPDLEHTHAQVSNLLLKEAGEELIQQCRELYPRGIEDNTVAITDAFGLQQFKYIFHVVPPQNIWNPGKAAELLEALRSRVESCLRMASVKELDSIVFPALATGTLRYPAEVEVKTVLKAARDFFICMPHSSLKRVTFVSYHRNPQVAKVFKAEETLYRFNLQSIPDFMRKERRFRVRDGLVQVVQGDVMTQRCTAQLLICAEPPQTASVQDYQEQTAEDCKVQTVKQDRSTANRIRDIFKNAKPSSVQINLQTFDAQYIDDVVSGVEKGLNNTRNVLIVILIAPSIEIYNRTCRKLSQSQRPLSAQGVERRSRDEETAVVHLCGQLNDVQKATTKVKETVVPDNYQQAETYNLHPTFVERHETGPVAAATPSDPTSAGDGGVNPSSENPSLEADEPVTVSIPREQLRGIDMERILDVAEALKMSVSFSRGSTKFRTQLKDLAAATNLVQNTIAGLAQPGAVLGIAAAAVSGEQFTDAGQTAGSFRIPASYQLGVHVQSSSDDFDKNVTQLAPGNAPADRNSSSVDRPAEDSYPHVTLPQSTDRQPGDGLTSQEGQTNDVDGVAVTRLELATSGNPNAEPANTGSPRTTATYDTGV